MTGLYVASNSTALGSQFSLTRNMGELANTLTRLSTGLRINSGKDDPAGLIASELLKADITGTTKAITNTQRANSMIATADSSLGQVSSLLNDIKGLVVEGANEGAMSADQIAANQMQINASVDAIDRIAKSTTYGGTKLLDGSMDFQTSGINRSVLGDVKITNANFGTADAVDVKVDVMETAKRGTLIYNGTGVSQKTSIDITGSKGTETFTFGAGTSNTDMAARINAMADSTGVSARVEGVAQRGQAILSSAGANNDILITANEKGLDAGNYSFRIVHGGTANSIEIMSEPDKANPGVVEIRLKDTYDSTFSNFADLFNVTVDGQYAVDVNLDADTYKSAPAGTAPTTAVTAEQAESSVSLIKGTSNSARFYTELTEATGKTKNGTQAVVTTAGTNTRQSSYNGWTVKIDDSVDATTYADGKVDLENKTISFNSAINAGATDNSAIETALATAFGNIFPDTGAGGGAPEISISGNVMKAGDSFTLNGGGDAGELVLTYKEGATADDLLKLANNASQYVNVSLKNGVNGSTLIPNIPEAASHVENKWAAANTPDVRNNKNPYQSSATANDVIELINSELGHLFTASTLNKDTGLGRVSFMDAAVDYGDVNLDNALRFTGMDDGPLVRLVTGAPNKQLGLTVKQPTPEDAALGIHTPILEIQLATDSSGNSISTAKDIADLFDRLGANETLGVSAEILYPPGVDPNGGTWVDDGCGNITYQEGCPEPYGLGIVQPTGVPGDCNVQQNDLVLLGQNETIRDTQAVARIYNADNAAVAQVAAASADDPLRAGGVALTFGMTSALNGLSFAFTTDVTKAGFNKNTGDLVMYLDPTTLLADGQANDQDAASDVVDRAIASNWEAIREYTGATGSWTQAKLDRDTSALTVAALQTAATTYDAANGTLGFSTIPPSTSATAGEAGTRGIGENDPVLMIKAKDAGTDMAGVTIKFVQNDQLTPYNSTAYPVTGAADGDSAMQLNVSYTEDENGNKTLIVEGNMGQLADGTKVMSIDSVVLANSLNANSDFNKLFTAEAPLAATPADPNSPVAAEGLGTVAFTDGNKIAGVTVGGYAIESAKNDAGNTTSSGIGMTGQSDSNERLILEATETGSENFVKVSVGQGSFDTYCPLGVKMDYLAGTDAVATINGVAATARGNNISIDTSTLAMSMNVANEVGSSSFRIDGGGAVLQLGPNVVSAQQMRIGIGSMLSSQLGGASGTLMQLKNGGDADITRGEQARVLADKIVNESISYVANTRGRLGAIQRSSLDPNIAMLQDSLVALTDAEASISNADFAEESSNLTRLQLLVQAGIQTLGIANQFPQYAASLVR